MGDHFADRLTAAVVRTGGPVCVGLDPVPDRLPAALRAMPIGVALAAFGQGVIEAVKDTAAAVKPQLACYERHGVAGLAAYEATVAAAKAAGLLVIADAKRGDIGISAGHYAAALLGPDGVGGGADAVTVSPYLGPDTLEPFVEAATRHGAGLFVLVRTSNPGSAALQRLRLDDGREVCEAVADQVVTLGERSVGACGYSAIGAVVGATHPEDAARLRGRMARQVFLVPGYGAQGGGVAEVLPCFNGDGAGALITASRSVIYAYEKMDADDWREPVRAAAAAMRDELAAGLRGGGG
ncbi:MAG: orotidine-5'-phosphate decarboxylase [Planctomycetota bacterium]